MTAQVANVQSQDDGWTFLDKSTYSVQSSGFFTIFGSGKFR